MSSILRGYSLTGDQHLRIIITGTSRGIGLELTSQAIAAGHHVLAIARHPDDIP